MNRIEIDGVFRDDTDGSDFDRPGWKELEKKLGPGDLVICRSVEVFTTDAEAGSEKFASLSGRGADLVFLRGPQPPADGAEGGVFKFLASGLEREEGRRRLISRRTKEAMAEKKRKGDGWSAGRKAGCIDKMTPELQRDILEYLSGVGTGTEIARRHGICRNTFAKYCGILRNM